MCQCGQEERSLLRLKSMLVDKNMLLLLFAVGISFLFCKGHAPPLCEGRGGVVCCAKGRFAVSWSYTSGVT